MSILSAAWNKLISGAKKSLSMKAPMTLGQRIETLTPAQKVIGGAALGSYATSLAPGAVSSGVSKFFSNPLANVKKGAETAATIGGLYVGGSIALKSKKVQQTIINAPKEVNTFTTDVSKLIDNPNIQNLRTTVSNSPLISGGVGLASLGVIGYKTGSLLNTFYNSQQIKKNTEVFSQGKDSNIIKESDDTLKIAKINAELQRDILKSQEKQAAEERKAQLQALKLQNELTKTSQTAPSQVVESSPSISPQTKKKKKTSKKAKKKTTKKKVSKKKKPTKKKTTKKKTSKKKKTTKKR